MFSVVIPLYNKELSIQNTIQSVLNQICQDFEIVVVNDGSTDNSAKIVEGINDDRIRLIHQENQGVSAARNRCIKEAKHEWIALLDGDDLWEVSHLDEINKMMDMFPSEKVYVTSFEYSDKREIFKHTRQTPIFKIENYFKEAIQEKLICSSNVVIYKNCFNDVGGFNELLKYGEDLELWARLARRYSITKSEKITATYKVDAENRAGIAKDVKESIAFHLPLSTTTDIDVYNYYKNIIFQRMFAYFRRLDFKNFHLLKRKYVGLTYKDFITYVSFRLKNRS